MPSNSYPFIAKEGWLVLFLLASLSFVLYLNAYDIWAAVLFGLMVLGLILFRDPPRAIPPAPLGIVSPVHGTVVDIDEVDSPWLERRAKRIRIHMSIFNIYSLRGPIEGKVVDQWCKTTSHGNEKPEYAYWIQTDEKDDIVTVLSQRRPRWFYKIYLQSGHRIGQGQRCGYIYFGTPIDVYLPSNVRTLVEPGQKVRSGSDILAHLVHTEQVSALDEPETAVEKNSLESP